MLYTTMSHYERVREDSGEQNIEYHFVRGSGFLM